MVIVVVVIVVGAIYSNIVGDTQSGHARVEDCHKVPDLAATVD